MKSSAYITFFFGLVFAFPSPTFAADESSNCAEAVVNAVGASTQTTFREVRQIVDQAYPTDSRLLREKIAEWDEALHIPGLATRYDATGEEAVRATRAILALLRSHEEAMIQRLDFQKNIVESMEGEHKDRLLFAISEEQRIVDSGGYNANDIAFYERLLVDLENGS